MNYDHHIQCLLGIGMKLVELTLMYPTAKLTTFSQWFYHLVGKTVMRKVFGSICWAQ